MAIGTLAIVATLVTGPGQVSSIGNAESEALAAFNRLMNASALCDHKEVDRLTSPDWIEIRSDGGVYAREEAFKDRRLRCKPGPPAILKDLQVRTHGDDTAIVTTVCELRQDGQVAPGPMRLTSVLDQAG
jgi:Domain of unknown function (DUF4440)